MKKSNVLKWVLFAIAIATNIFILVNSFINGDASTVESKFVTEKTAGVINGVSPGFITSDNQENFVILIRKIFGHFALFGLSGFVSSWTFYLFLKEGKFKYFLYFGSISLLFGIVLAWMSEFIQLFIPGRSGSASDFLINLFGYFIGDLLVILILFIAKKPIFSNSKQQEK